ncbi:5-methylthioribose kinase [Klebsiella pneumoniae]|nr:5-methylthioribose kinase [Klebsiella pneumoniae]
MSQYHTFTAHDAVPYAQQFAGIDNPSELVSAQEVGDGNLNLVFKVFDPSGRQPGDRQTGPALCALRRRILAADPRPSAVSKRRPWSPTISTAHSTR